MVSEKRSIQGIVSTKIETKVKQMEKEIKRRFIGLKIEVGSVNEELKGIQMELREFHLMRRELTKIKDILVMICQKEIKGKFMAK